PDQLRLLRDEPDRAPEAIDELLRYDSPVQFTGRQARKELAIGGKAVRAGDFVLLVLGAANRDPEQFPDPDRLDVTRREVRHLAFAHGPHFCLGAPLARMEGQIALRALLERFPNLCLAADRPEHRANFNLRGLKALP